MGMGQVSVAAATAVLGYDLARDQVWKTSGVDRVLTGIACAGSAAAADTKFDVMIDTVKIGEVYNTATGFPTQDHYFEFDNYIPAGSGISLIVTDAASTNPINVILQWDEMD